MPHITETDWGLQIWHMRVPYARGEFHLSQAFVHAPHWWQRLFLRWRGYRPHPNPYWWIKSGTVKWRTLELMSVHDIWFNNPPNKRALAHHVERLKDAE